jgi:hypothetical protein
MRTNKTILIASFAACLVFGCAPASWRTAKLTIELGALATSSPGSSTAALDYPSAESAKYAIDHGPVSGPRSEGPSTMSIGCSGCSPATATPSPTDQP